MVQNVGYEQQERVGLLVGRQGCIGRRGLEMREYVGLDSGGVLRGYAVHRLLGSNTRAGRDTV